jgi:hypothetical protein
MVDMIHVRYEGRSYDVQENDLRLDQMASDGQILETLARFYEFDFGKLRHYVVDRRPSGAVIVRPEAVYG